jgi:hypothetical protein
VLGQPIAIERRSGVAPGSETAATVSRLDRHQVDNRGQRVFRYVGLDIDLGCVKMAAELVAALGIVNVHFELIDGRQYDFGGFDFVYVANHVVPKRAVFEQIARSTSVRRVVVREPTRIGELLAEAVRSNLPPVFVADAAGAESGLMSYDLLLRRV